MAGVFDIEIHDVEIEHKEDSDDDVIEISEVRIEEFAQHKRPESFIVFLDFFRRNTTLIRTSMKSPSKS